MQITRNKIYFTLFGFVLIIAVIISLLALQRPPQSDQSPPEPTPGQTSDPTPLPGYTLSQQEEANLAQFVSNFINLYNSYSYQDLSNPYSLGDFETISMQERVVGQLRQLDTALEPGYSIRTESDPISFSYHYPQTDALTTKITGRVKENQTNLPTKNYTVTATLQLVKSDSGHWLVDSVDITTP